VVIELQGAYRRSIVTGPDDASARVRSALDTLIILFAAVFVSEAHLIDSGRNSIAH